MSTTPAITSKSPNEICHLFLKDILSLLVMPSQVSTLSTVKIRGAFVENMKLNICGWSWMRCFPRELHYDFAKKHPALLFRLFPLWADMPSVAVSECITRRGSVGSLWAEVDATLPIGNHVLPGRGEAELDSHGTPILRFLTRSRRIKHNYLLIYAIWTAWIEYRLSRHPVCVRVARYSQQKQGSGRSKLAQHRYALRAISSSLENHPVVVIVSSYLMSANKQNMCTSKPRDKNNRGNCLKASQTWQP